MIGAALGLLLIALTSTPAFAHPLFHLRTKVPISMHSPSADVFKECVYREMRKIPEVIVVGDGATTPDYVVSLAVLRERNRGGYNLGYSAAVDFFSPLNPDDLNPYWKDKNSETMGRILISGAVIRQGQYVLTDYSLSSLCRRIVALFDTHPVEQMRQFIQRVHEHFRGPQNTRR